MVSRVKFFPAARPGDIVWCHFAKDKILKPGPKSRPGLVVKVGRIAGEPAVAVAYGTGQNVGELHPGEFAIIRADRDLTGGDQDADGDRKIESARFFRQLGWRQIDRDSA